MLQIKINKLFQYFLTLFFLYEVIIADDVNDPNICPKVRFDYILLSVQWTPGQCAFNRRCVRGEEKWSIHGVWPNNYEGRHPSDCCFLRHLDDSVLDELHVELSKNWGSNYGKDYPFWRHEWSKHGTCAYGSRPLQGQLNYFARSLQLFRSIDLDGWLRRAQIIPKSLNQGSAYSLKALHDAIERKHGKRVRFACRILKRGISSLPILNEINLCFDKNSLKPIDCGREDDRECGTNLVNYISID